MNVAGYAFFVKNPRRINDLIAPHDVQDERPFEVVQRITLPAIDYENFISDFTVSRRFIEQHAFLCSSKGGWRCLLITQRNSEEGILVMPWERSWAGWAAWYRFRRNCL